jgi:oligoribonuclease (3'-5' exoribonuclease)
MSKHQFLWFDVETTGLVPEEGLLLEWAVALAEDDAGGDCTIVQEYTAAVSHDCTPGARLDTVLSADPSGYVRKMHTKNGLLADVEASTTTIMKSDLFLRAICQELTGKDEPKGLELAGFSPHFDHAWCCVHLPRFAACLSHRVFNVSTLRRMADPNKRTPIGIAPSTTCMRP